MTVGLLLALTLVAQTPDTTTYADLATLELLQMARERHRAQDTLVSDYSAHIETRMELRAGRSRFARLVPLWVHETAARVVWRRPDQLNLRVEGVRARSVFPNENIRVGFSEPWFVPRALGDSIRLLGIPETAALHPLAANAEEWYRFAIVDSSVITVPGLTVRAVAVRVTPKRVGPSLVAGDMWLDRATGDVVRLSVAFLGEYVWGLPDNATAADSADARNENKWAQRFVQVQADLEYSLVDNRFWMPWRQLLAVTASIDFLISGAAPARILTTFSQYRVNANAPVAFTVEPDSGRSSKTVVNHPDSLLPRGNDSLRAQYGFTRTGTSSGIRWEIVVPPADSLIAHQWAAPLSVDLQDGDRERVERFLADIERFAEGLPDEWMARPRLALSLERVPDLIRFNRVQGVSIGGAVAWRPGLPFTTVRATARFGFGDLRPTGSLGLRREGPEGRLDVSVYRRVMEAEPWTDGQGFGNSINAGITGHDDADYHLSLGGGVSWEFYRGPLAGVTLTAAAERQRSMSTEAGSAINDLFWGDGIMAPNPPIAEGDWLIGRIKRRIDRPLRATLGIDGMTEASGLGQGARGWIDSRVRFRILGRGGAVSLKGGTSVGDAIPQLAFRLGGPRSVRGYPYGFVASPDFWSAQLDLALRSEWMMSPVLFVDVGDTDFRGEPLVGVGGGLSFLGGAVRLNLSKGLNPSGDVRFDLLFGAPR